MRLPATAAEHTAAAAATFLLACFWLPGCTHLRPAAHLSTWLPCAAAWLCRSGKAKRQLQVAGQILVWLLHVGTPGLMAATPVELSGVIAVQGWPAAEEAQQLKLEELKISCAGLDASSNATMQLELFLF